MKIGLLSMAATAALVLSTTSALAQAPTPSPSSASARSPAKAAPATTTVTTSEYVEQQQDGSQVINFGTDNLDGDPLSAYGFTLRRPPGVLRQFLIRPRMNFVSELLKSVENI